MRSIEDTRVVVIATLRFPQERAAEAMERLKPIVDAFRLHDGNIAYDISRDCYDPAILRGSEMWLNHDCLQRHSAHQDVVAWNTALKGCGVIDQRYVVCDVSHVNIVAMP